MKSGEFNNFLKFTLANTYYSCRVLNIFKICAFHLFVIMHILPLCIFHILLAYPTLYFETFSFCYNVVNIEQKNVRFSGNSPDPSKGSCPTWSTICASYQILEILMISAYYACLTPWPHMPNHTTNKRGTGHACPPFWPLLVLLCLCVWGFPMCFCIPFPGYRDNTRIHH